MSMYDAAYVIAQMAHCGQQRKKNGESYINHCLRVASKFKDERERSVAILHDSIEDARDEEARDTLEKVIEFNCGEDVLGCVKILTKRPGEPYLDYILRVMHGGLPAMRIKLADLEDNLKDLEPGTKRDKYLLAQYILKGAEDNKKKQ